MSYQNAYKASKIIETIENYAVSDVLGKPLEEENPGSNYPYFLDDDSFFWENYMYNPDDFLNKTLEFNDVGLSEWIARVPGLFFHQSSKLLHKLAESHVEYVGQGWKHYNPSGKSQKVLGGIGTINLPPSENGWYIASISTTNNASTGIPVLISEEVWDHHRLREGIHILKGKGKWMRMSESWAERFPSIQNIPQAYLRINDPDDLVVENHSLVPTVFHPFSIMEYEKDNAKFFDFVYVTVDSSEQIHKQNYIDFFNTYRTENDRNGRYLIEPFINAPILSTEYTLFSSPEELRKNVLNSSHLSLLVARVQQELFNGVTIDSIKIAIDTNLNIDQLKRFSEWIKINPNKWFTDKPLYDESALFIDACLREGKLEEFVDLFIKDYGAILLKQP